jgi:hypothetical protein
MGRTSRALLPAFCWLAASRAYAQDTSEPEQVSMTAFLIMCGFVLLAVLMVCSIIAQGLLAYQLVSREGRMGRAILWLASMVSDVRVTDGPRNSERKGSTGKRL